MTNVWGILHCYMTGDPVFGISKFDRNAVPQPFVIDARRVATVRNGAHSAHLLPLGSRRTANATLCDRRDRGGPVQGRLEAAVEETR